MGGAVRVYGGGSGGGGGGQVPVAGPPVFRSFTV